MPEPVALLRQSSYTEGDLRGCVFRVLEAAGLDMRKGMHVLVKPNLLLNQKLACTSPQVTAAVCEWLLAQGVKVSVGDSPAFGSATSVAAAIGLALALKPLGLAVETFSNPVKTPLELYGLEERVFVGVARQSLECDRIISVPRVKAHSQMRITLAVKNCFGCVCGLRKAIAHARFGRSVTFFSDCVAALYAALPPVSALCDGIVAMNVTGPCKGEPFPLELLGASASAPALDNAVLAALNLGQTDVPLAAALKRRGIQGEISSWPLARPADFNASGFKVPGRLAEISFTPPRLAQSLLKRVWARLRP